MLNICMLSSWYQQFAFNHSISVIRTKYFYSAKYQGDTSKLVFFKILEVHALAHYSYLLWKPMSVKKWLKLLIESVSVHHWMCAAVIVVADR